MTLAAIVLASSMLFIPPRQVPPGDPMPRLFWQVDWFSVPSGPLPWELPNYPIVDLDVTTPSDTLNGVSHGATYADQIADMQARYAAIETPISNANDLADSWIGGEELPDMTAGDFDTGLDPLGTGSMNASDFATELATNIGTVYQYMRLLTTFDLGGTAYVVGFIFICMAWMMFITFVKFGVQIVDMVFSVVVSVIELIPVAE